MDKADRLREIVERGDPDEWLRVLQHEATRANNAEADLLRLRQVARALFLDPDDPSAAETIFDPYGALDELDALAKVLGRMKL
jgi:hypothetical protein